MIRSSRRSSFQRLTLALLALILSASLAAAQDSQFEAISARMRQYVQQDQMSGAVTLVGHNGKIVHLSAVGKADVEENTPMQEDSMFCIASMTKPITATAMMILQDEGKLSIDDPVEKYIPAFAEAKLRAGEPVRELTIRHLLTHTSGLGGSQQCEGSLAQTAQELAAQPFDFQPGQRWQYSPGLNVAGRIVEIVSGQPYEKFLAERIFQPLGMRDTTFHPTVEQQKRIVTLYRPGEDGEGLAAADHWLNRVSPDRVPNPSGGLFSTAPDMFRFYQMILDGGTHDGKQIVSSDSVRAMTTLQSGKLSTGFTPGCGWGLGWCLVRDPQGVSESLSASTFGHGGAFGTQGWIDPEKKMIFVLMIQRTDFGNSDGSDVRGEFQRIAVEKLSEGSR
ncbi:MAG: serine hydrolase domain-containing protein [Pirellulales bacterium]